MNLFSKLLKKGLIPALMLCVPAAGCARTQPVPDADILPALTVYTSHTEDVYGPIIKEFQERTGIWVTVVTGGSNYLFERIAEEASAPVCDVMFGGGADSHESYKACLEPYISAEAPSIQEAYRSADGSWTAFSALPIVIVYNTKMIQPENAPTGWAALLDVNRRGQIAFANPAVSASCFTALSAVLQAGGGDWRETETLFARNIAGEQLESSQDIVPAVLGGQYPIGVTLEEAAYRQRREGKELTLVYPEEGVCSVPDATALVVNAPNPENARLFIDFTVSREVQHMLAADTGRRPVRGDVDHPRGLGPLTEAGYDYSWSIANRAAILELWERECQ